MIKNKEFLVKTLSHKKYTPYLEELPTHEELLDINKELCDLGCFVHQNDILEVLRELKLKRSME
jgi:hypothetical protein